MDKINITPTEFKYLLKIRQKYKSFRTLFLMLNKGGTKIKELNDENQKLRSICKKFGLANYIDMMINEIKTPIRQGKNNGPDTL